MGILKRTVRYLRGRRIKPLYKRYISFVSKDSPLRDYPITIVGDCSVDPTETFNHYDIFAFWEAKRLADIGTRLDILDIGNKKAINAALSAQHNVTSIVLADCGDDISEVKYLKHDVSDPLPFSDNFFNVFTSAATLHLIGLGRYGDRVNPNALPDFIKELGRVMMPSAHLIFSIQCGKETRLFFNNGWVFTLEKIKELFNDWKLVDYIIAPHLPGGEYQIALVHFIRK